MIAKRLFYPQPKGYILFNEVHRGWTPRFGAAGLYGKVGGGM
jgi:hypothetical protein